MIYCDKCKTQLKQDGNWYKCEKCKFEVYEVGDW